ncbi:universal stress protein [Streptomyces olivoverticillatus]
MELPVVVGTDGSLSSLQAVDWATDAALRRGLPLRIVHAVPVERAHRRHAAPWAEEVCALATERAERHSPQLKVVADLVFGDPAVVLPAASYGASLVVVGCRGHGGPGGALLGPVGTDVAAHAHCPVVVVRGRTANLRGCMSRVTVGIDRQHPDGAPLRFAFAEAARRRCEVEAVHGRPGADRERLWSRVVDTALRTATAAHPEVPLVTRPAQRPVHAALLRASADTDLLVLGAPPRDLPGSPLGPANAGVLQQSRCPVAIVPRAWTD